ncbi:protein kinase [Microcystis aeruginosa BLCCF158]|uniref:non-specific serine/threonine protein kinase n=1 Tax=Microcystis aeruginosa BLCC-F158 TaxID=2755316 RepID=A0A841UYZ4_MICAE|nr:protein kinase [Microcystis aeruginosa]MBC1196353.1 protein kinase [Microcystis aeruginosa BLCC-F158]
MVWQAGQLLHNGKYEILEVLGRGGFGLTYKARHRQLIMEVVIKTPDILQKRDTEYEDYVRQFEAEGRKLAKFSQTPHAHIVRISDFFTEGQVPCLVMDFIQGQTLMERVKTQGKLSEAECLKYIRQIGSALEVVHQAGMVHRDAHPGNIMIQPNGNAILIDFGIAKEIIPAGSSSTDYAANPSFAPYEQVYKGSKANRQPSVDIYALAASFYYAVTGQKPTPSMERRLDNRPLTSPKEINPNLSDHLNKAITLGMALEKENRPQSMSDWLQQLELPPPPVEEKYRREIVNIPPAVEEKYPQETVNIPPAVEEKYPQEIVNPPRSVKLPKEPEAAKSTPKFNPKSAQNSVLGKRKYIPWELVMSSFALFINGYILGFNQAPLEQTALAVFGVVVGVCVVGESDNNPSSGSALLLLGSSICSWFGSSAIFLTLGSIGGWREGWTMGIHSTYFFTLDERLMPFVSSILSYFFAIIVSLIGVLIGGGSILFLAMLWLGSLLSLVEEKYDVWDRRFYFLFVAGTNLSGLAIGWLLAFLLHSKG